MMRKFIIGLNIGGHVSDEDLEAYILDAVSSWGGGGDPDGDLFPANWDSDSVEVKVIKGTLGEPYNVDGLMISEIVINVALTKNKGRVTREEHRDLALIANKIRDEREKLKEALESLGSIMENEGSVEYYAWTEIINKTLNYDHISRSPK